MFGNRFTSDDIAKNFQQELAKRKQLKKQAQDASVSEKKPVSPEDFLVSPTEQVDVHSEDLNSKIQEVESYAKDPEKCDKCQENHAGDCALKNDAEDMSFLVDKKAKYVLFQLGKIAQGLRSKDKGFAADMVEATALEIKQETVKKAGQKLQVISELKKMASESYKDGDQLTGDVISVTIENIKKSS